MDNLQDKVRVLSSLKGDEIKTPGKYICLQCCGYPISPTEQPVWIVDVYEVPSAAEGTPMLVYVTPTDYTERTVADCGHSFYSLD